MSTAAETGSDSERDLDAREAQYRRIFEATTDGLVIGDLQAGIVVEANPAFCKMHGYTYEEMLGLHPTAFIHPDYHRAFAHDIEVIISGGDYRTEAVDVRSDGTTFPVEVHGAPFLYRGKPHVLGVVRDITERVKSDEQIQLKEQERVRALELLEQRVDERTRELSALLEVSRSVGLTLELGPLLEVILDQLRVVINYRGAAVMLRESDGLHVLARRAPGPDPNAGPAHYPIESTQWLWSILERGEPIIIDDVRGDDPFALAYQESVGDLLHTAFRFERSWMGVPMMVQERAIGVLTLSSDRPGHYRRAHADLTLAIAQQAGAAIENAKLYARAQELAALEERQRLARELHDSVSQALFGISLGTHTARTLLDRDLEQARASMDYVYSLAQAGMAEMRALIFELRPESLETQGLVVALEKHAAALTARHEIPVEASLCEEPDMPLKVKEALYRVAQEAMHNTIKHARATQVHLTLDCPNDTAVLTVQDDGRGFDTGGSYPGHLGLDSMHERVGRLGGTLEITSGQGRGTSVSATIPRGHEARHHSI